MELTYTQDDIDRAFADLDSMLADRPTPHQTTNLCVQCGHNRLVRAAPPYDGELVCDACGIVQPGLHLPPQYYFPLPRKYSNYKRIHHWHERISQLLLLESEIPDKEFRLIASKLCDGTHTTLNKDCIRSVLRSLNLQLYIEKWLQIIQRITGIMPPMPGPLLVRQLDTLFQELQAPFNHYKLQNRKNFLNYNYVFCRLFQKMGCTQFCMFFPLIKSKSKLRALDDMWTSMTSSIDWEQTNLQVVAPFAVKLEQPVVSRFQIASSCDDRDQVVRWLKHGKRGYQTSDHSEIEKTVKPLKLRRSDQLVLQPQKFGWPRVHFRHM